MTKWRFLYFLVALKKNNRVQTVVSQEYRTLSIQIYVHYAGEILTVKKNIRRRERSGSLSSGPLLTLQRTWNRTEINYLIYDGQIFILPEPLLPEIGTRDKNSMEVIQNQKPWFAHMAPDHFTFWSFPLKIKWAL
jgi:hypothetical protein